MKDDELRKLAEAVHGFSIEGLFIEGKIREYLQATAPAKLRILLDRIAKLRTALGDYASPDWWDTNAARALAADDEAQK